MTWSAGGGVAWTLQSSPVDAGTWQAVGSEVLVASQDAALLPEGHMDLRVIARDGVGNTLNSPVARDVVVDRTAPTWLLDCRPAPWSSGRR